MKEFEKFIHQLKLEAVALAILMIVLTNESSYSLWVLPITFLLFDAGMIGYLKNAKTGALFYNLTHNLTTPTVLIAGGVFFDAEAVAVIGFCWTFHIAVDRALGFGLKKQDIIPPYSHGNNWQKEKVVYSDNTASRDSAS